MIYSNAPKSVKVFATCVALISFVHPSRAETFDKEMSRIADQISSAVDAAGAKTVATADFVDLQGNVSQLGRFIAEEISTDLVLSKKKFSVVDRANLKRIMDEHKLTMSGLVDPENAKKLGQLAGVDALIVGTITPFENNIRTSIKIITTDSAKVVGAARGDITKTKSIDDLYGQNTPGTISGGDGTASKGGPPRIADLTRMVSFTLESVRFTKQGALSISGSLMNRTSSEIAVYAGTPENFGHPGGERQKLQVSAIDDSGNKYAYSSATGFTLLEMGLPPRHAVYAWDNQYVRIPPGESAPVTLSVECRNHPNGAPQSVDVLIEFRVCTDTKALQTVDKTVSFRKCSVQ